jgi:muramidase (phage lysozyme)/murein DD-endopeptidase MepM/ murein hydrolase activator NlpD
VIGPNARALLDTIRLPEGTSGAQGYNTMFTGKTFSDLSRHPRQINRSNGLASDAAGAYQFLSPTWDSAARDLGLKDFSPASQDLAALHLIRRRGVDPDKPLTREALAKLAPEWASLPTMQGKSYYGQPVMAADKLLSYYQSRLKGNGVMAAPSTHPVAAAPNPVSPRASSPLEAVAAGILGSAGEAGGFRVPAPSAMRPKAAAAEASGLEGVVGAILDNSFTGSPGKRKRFAASSELLPGLFKAATGLPIEDLESLMSGAGRPPRFRSTPGFDAPAPQLSAPQVAMPADASRGLQMGRLGGATTNRTRDSDGEQSGYDIVKPGGVGAPIVAPVDLEITGKGFQGQGSGESGRGYGNWLSGRFTGADGKPYELLLGHLNDYSVKPGMKVPRGTVLGSQGVTGRAFGAHVTTHVNALSGGNPWQELDRLTDIWTAQAG